MKKTQDMSEVAILAPFGLDNYGNRLQGCAVNQLLEDEGLHGKTIAITKSVSAEKARSNAKRIVSKHGARQVQRFNAFRQFARNYTPYEYYSPASIKQQANSFSCFIVGSDQVWYPGLGARFADESLFFAPFVESGRKIALSPSFGVDVLPASMAEAYRSGLSTFTALSVREDAGATIIKELVGVDAEVLVDPTMAVEPGTWRMMANYRLCPDEPYMLVYSLDKLAANAYAMLDEYAKSHGLRIIDLMDRSKAWYCAGPAEFIALIDKADYVVTNSYHGSVFSIMLHTPFCMTQRESSYMLDMSSRMQTLLRKFDCSSRLLNGESQALPTAEMPWDFLDKRCAEESDKLKSYLHRSIIRCYQGGEL